MEGMSDIRNDIEKRLGVFARPGAKATFASDVDLVMEQARKMHSNWKPIAERDQNKPNAGTRGGVEGYASSAIHFLGNHIRDLKKYSKRADKKEAEAAKAGLKEVADMMKYWEAMYRKVTASRPGAKSMMSASRLYVLAYEDRTPHRIHVRSIAEGIEVLKQNPNAAASLIHESETNKRTTIAYGTKTGRVNWTDAGIEVSRAMKASRPGAKETFAANDVDLWNFLAKSDVKIARQNASDLATLKKYAKMALTKPNFTPPAYAQNGPSLHAMAKDTLADIKAFEESAYRARNPSPFSRPGAKADMGLEDACWKGYEAVGMKTKDGKDVPNCVPKSTHAADGFYGGSEADAVRHMAAYDKTCAECNAEDTKLGDKIAMATDPAVSKKIGKLMDEGYPQNQAIAIALEMKRKGEI
jgi:hypothetical protein